MIGKLTLGLLMAAGILLAGCQTTEDRIAADDAQCRSYGTRPGDQNYINCRMNLDTNRSNVKAAQRFGMGEALIKLPER